MISLEEIRRREYKPGSNPGPESFCTIIDSKGLWEGMFSLYSIRRFHDQPIYVVCDEETRSVIEHLGIKDVHTKLDVNKKSNDKILNGIFKGGSNKFNEDWHFFHPIELMFRKPDVVDYALSENSNTLFVDGDIYYVNPTHVVYDSEVGLYPQCANYFLGKDDIWREKMEAKYGLATGSMVYTKCKDFTDWWREATINDSVYYEQECLTRADEVYDVKFFPATEQLQSYHFQGYGDMSPYMDLPCDSALEHTGWKIDNGLHVQAGEVTSFHFHLDLGGVQARGQEVDYKAKILGRIFLTMLAESDREEHADLLQFYNDHIRVNINPECEFKEAVNA